MLNFIPEKYKKWATLAGLALAMVPFLKWVPLPLQTNAHDISLYIALITGFAGVILLMGQFFLGSRSITGLFFQDIAWTLKVHKYLGIYGTLLVFLHPLFILIPYAQGLGYIFVPHINNPFEVSVTYGRIALFAMLTVWVTSALVRKYLRYRPWKYIHYTAYIALPLAFIHSPTIGRTFLGAPEVMMYWYALEAAYLFMIALRLRHVFGYSKRQYVVKSIRPLTDDVFLMRLRAKDLGVHPHPGQYVYLQRSLVGETHPFSVVDFSIESRELLVAFKRFGSFSRRLSQIQPGVQLYVDGPYGNFTYQLGEATDRPRVFIAGGIGITPFVRHILRAPDNTQQYLFYGNRTIRGGSFRDLLKQKLGKRYVDVLSGEQQRTQPNVEQGYIDASVLAKYIENPRNFEYFICGPAPMMEHVRRNLLSLGVAPGVIHTEEFSF